MSTVHTTEKQRKNCDFDSSILKVHKIEIFVGLDLEICIISLNEKNFELGQFFYLFFIGEPFI